MCIKNKKDKLKELKESFKTGAISQNEYTKQILKIGLSKNISKKKGSKYT